MDRKLLFWHKKITFGIAVVVVLLLVLSAGKTTAAIAINPRLVDRVISTSTRNYIDPASIKPAKILSEALMSLEKQVPEIISKEDGQGKVEITIGLAKKQFRSDVKNFDELRQTLKDIVDFVSANYTGELKSHELEALILDGALTAFDPHSGFLTKKVYNEFKIGTQGEFGGLGIVITIKDGWLTVISPIEDTPAFRAGIRSGDRIVQIGDESTINMSLTDAVNKLRGKVGSTVAIVVERSGKPVRKVTLTRALINIESVKYTYVTAAGKKIGYIGVKNFQANTVGDVKNALKEFNKSQTKISGIILDLRNNPGGLLNSSIELADLFLKEGTIVSTVGQGGEEFERNDAHDGGFKSELPVVVLINEGSASASEIVAGALKIHDRAIVLGSPSFGKGSVQTVFEMDDDTALKLTIAMYMAGGKESIQTIGVVPDIELVPAVVDKEEVNLSPDKHTSEVDLEQHLIGKTAEKKPEPIARVSYLKPKESKGEDVDLIAEAKKEYAKVPKLEGDFEVEFAAKIVAKAGKVSRSETLAAAKPIISEEQKSESQKIESALKLQGVDWSTAQANGKPALKLSSQVKLGGQVVQKAKAGQKVSIELSATNTGNGTYSQLLAIGQSESAPILANLEFPFGKIKPGETKTASVPLELPENALTQNLEMDVNFTEGNANAPAATKVFVPVEALPEPRFSFSYSTPKKIEGKPILPSVQIPLDVTVTNAGPGSSSKETFVSISDECDEKIFIEKGREKFENMKPGESRQTKFSFHLLPGFDDSNCSLDLAVVDIKKGQILSKRIKIAPSTGSLLPKPGTKLSPPKITLNDVLPQCKCENINITGTIEDADPIKDYFVFVGDRKVEYSTNPNQQNKISFSVNVPLKEGNNMIVIGARDELKIVGTKAFVVDRLKK